ncbi:lamin tail domain-containing protein, partial [Verrucomicrobia bacterium]|nr:lamin tail domain-containing protein [Verrucomicrobiota bacterium]
MNPFRCLKKITEALFAVIAPSWGPVVLVCDALLVGLLSLSPSGLLHADSLMISEIMVQQGVSILFDEDRDAPDWIEIYNAAEEPHDLQGWSLSDEEGQARKWVFPEMVLKPKSFLVVFASGKDCRDAGKALHTNFKLSSQGEFLGLFSPDGDLASGFSPEYPKLSEG